MSNYETWYKNVNEFVANKNLSKKIVVLVRTLSIVIAISYIILIITTVYNTICNDFSIEIVMKVILVPMIAFIILSSVRSCINAQRPYTKYNITPLIDKKTEGNSFPSRHTFSGCIIAITWIYICWQIGIIIFVLSCMVAFLRVISGVHFPRDVIAAIIIAWILGVIGFWII